MAILAHSDLTQAPGRKENAPLSVVWSILPTIKSGKSIAQWGRARPIAAALLALGLTTGASMAQADTERGRYLVQMMGCGDCHTPGYFLGKPDMSRFLGGSEVAFEIPGLGAFAGPNLTPHETGIGAWSEADIVSALRQGKRPDGRELAPIMPWRTYAALADEDAAAIAAYLKTLTAVDNKVPGPFGPGDRVTLLLSRILPPGETAAKAP